MAGWLESYNQLTEEQQDRVQRWLHLNKFIAHTLRIPWNDWVDKHLTPCMQKPMDYSFMEATIAELGGLGVEGRGASFSSGMDPSTRLVRRVPLRARNNLGRLSPELQDRIAQLLERADRPRLKLVAADVAMLQKIFPAEKTLGRLKKPDFRKVEIFRDEDDLVLLIEGRGEEILRLNVLEVSAVLSRALI